ncbi:MAG: mechanosensitive ion channel family protein [Xanthomonadales bacterium]|nr:mechanosensitive ion channel family protein [Xanthomonadales bacterium]
MPLIQLNKQLSLVAKTSRFLLSLLLFSLFLTGPVFAAEENVDISATLEKDIAEDSAFKDNLGRDTPRSSFSGFLRLTEKFDYKTAANFLDMRNLPHRVSKLGGEELARQLDFVIKRGMKIDVQQLSRKPAGQVVDGLPDYRDELGRIVTDEGEQVLLLQRVPGIDDNYIWKVANVSIAHIPTLYDFFSYPDWVEKIRTYIPEDVGFLGVELFKWVIVIGVALVAIPVFWLIGFLLSLLLTREQSPIRPAVRKLFTWPLILLAVALISGQMLKALGLGATAQAIIESKSVMTIIVVWILFSLIDLAREKRRANFIAQGRSDAAILGRPMANALKLVVVLVAFLLWLHNTGIDITTLLTGLGIGGIALALALQKPIEDLLGAVSIYSQQPIITGDLCKYGNVLGKIEEIGLRTTRIRTLNNTLVSIPNCIIAHGAIENYSAREKMLYHPELPLRYDTSGEQMRQIIQNIDKLARAHEQVIEKSVRIRFTAFALNSMTIKARIYVDTSDFSTYLSVVDDLNMGIMEIVQNAGAHFAQGAQTIMLENSEPQNV